MAICAGSVTRALVSIIEKVNYLIHVIYITQEFGNMTYIYMLDVDEKLQTTIKKVQVKNGNNYILRVKVICDKCNLHQDFSLAWCIGWCIEYTLSQKNRIHNYSSGDRHWLHVYM